MLHSSLTWFINLRVGLEAALYAALQTLLSPRCTHLIVCYTLTAYSSLWPVLSCPVMELSLNLPFLHIFAFSSNSIKCHQIKCTFGRRLHQWLDSKCNGIQQGCTLWMLLLLLHSGRASMTHPWHSINCRDWMGVLLVQSQEQHFFSHSSGWAKCCFPISLWRVWSAKNWFFLYSYCI